MKGTEVNPRSLPTVWRLVSRIERHIRERCWYPLVAREAGGRELDGAQAKASSERSFLAVLP